MATVAQKLSETPKHLWQYMKDDWKRGPKDFYITGEWTEQGHCRPGQDTAHAAGLAGKHEKKTGEGITNFLQPYAQKASQCLQRVLVRKPHEELREIVKGMYYNFNILSFLFRTQSCSPGHLWRLSSLYGAYWGCQTSHG